MLHVDNSVSVSCRHIIRLYNTLQERILIPSEIQFLSSSFQTLLQNRIGTVNEITIKNVTINSQSYIYGEDVPQIDIVITIYGRYIPPPEIHFCKDLLMNEFVVNGNENLILYRNQLITYGSNYFSRLHSISISQYIPFATKKNNVENNIDSTSQIDEEKEIPTIFRVRKDRPSSTDNINHYKYNTQPEQPQNEERIHKVVQDVAVNTYNNHGTSNNYNTLYNIDGEDNNNSIYSLFESYSIDKIQNSIAFISILSFIGIILFSIVYSQRRKKRYRMIMNTNKSGNFIKNDFNKTNKRVTFSNDIQQSNDNNNNTTTKQRQSVSSSSSSIQNNAAKKVLISTSIGTINNNNYNNNQAATATYISAGFTGVTDYILKESKDISFKGVMDYENHKEHREQEGQTHKEHESYVSSLL